jgi:hypothetical protein
MTGPSAYNTRSKRSRSSSNPPGKSKVRPKKELPWAYQDWSDSAAGANYSQQAMMDIYLSGNHSQYIMTAATPSAPVEKKPVPQSTQVEEEIMRNPYTIPERSEAAWDMAKQVVAACNFPNESAYRHHFGVVLEDKNGKLSPWDALGACYYRLNNADVNNGWTNHKKLFFIDHGCRAWWRPEFGEKTNTKYYAGYSDTGPALTWEEAIEYADFMANKSVWKHAYIEKDPEKLLTGASIFHTTFPYRYLLQAGMLMRHLYDAPTLVRSFLEYKKHIKGSAAYFIASRYVLDKDNEIRYHKMIFHSPWDAIASGSEPQILKALYNRDFKFMKGMSLAEKEFGLFSGLYTTWGEKIHPEGFQALKVPEHDKGAPGSTFGKLDTRRWTNVGKFLEEVLVLNGIKGRKDA